ncbi:MAG: potassium-transporting ATPase subunit KdpA [Chloroflexaceae bacterium]|nr:potassium-transporting ATPase subunit KdpA [Chloroflexaceae bacterium]
MTINSLLQLGFFVLVLVALVKPLGWYMAQVFSDRPVGLDRVLGPVERLIYRAGGVRPAEEMTWKQYAIAMLLLNVAGWGVLYALLRLQDVLPFNPQGLAAPDPDTVFNITTSFVTNTNWQNYGGETTLSYLSQMMGLTVQNFLSPAMGIAVLVALTRGIARRSAATIGNFWVDLTRSLLYILLPLSLLWALLLISQGVVQTFSPYVPAHLIAPTVDSAGAPVTEQIIAVGPAASQVAIKQLGTNGGGFFNVNSAHPLENPTTVSNFFETLALVLIPAALCYTFGKLVNDTRQGWALLAVMLLVFIPLLVGTTYAEQQGNPRFNEFGIDQTASALQPGGNMEGKEARFGITSSALWAVATTAASNGSVNSMHDSYTPLGGLVPIWLMQLGEVIFGGVGSGLYGLLMFAVVAVFVAGLMVGRTPEYLGKKIEAYEMKMASLAILVPPAAVLLGSALAAVTPAGLAGLQDGGPHGFSEILYAFSSYGNNNGSAFAGLTTDSPFYNIAGGLAMFFARFWIALPVLAIAGSLAAKKSVPVGPGTLPTHTPLFVFLLAGVVVIVGALTFIPALALGPVIEHLLLYS